MTGVWTATDAIFVDVDEVFIKVEVEVEVEVEGRVGSESSVKASLKAGWSRYDQTSIDNL